MEELESKKESKVIRYTFWGILILGVALFTAFKAPEHSLDFVKDVIKDIIQYLVLGA